MSRQQQRQNSRDINSIRQEVEIPQGLFQRLFTRADPAKILNNIAKLDNPNDVVLALKGISGQLPKGMLEFLEKNNSPEFNASLHSALKNGQFRQAILTSDGSAQFANSINDLVSNETIGAIKGLGLSLIHI